MKPSDDEFLPEICSAFVPALPRLTPLLSPRLSVALPVFAKIPWSAVKSLTVKCPEASLRAIVLAVADVDCV